MKWADSMSHVATMILPASWSCHADLTKIIFIKLDRACAMSASDSNTVRNVRFMDGAGGIIVFTWLILSAHFIDKDWELLHDPPLEVAPAESSHTAECVTRMIKELAERNGIPDRGPVCVATDTRATTNAVGRGDLDVPWHGCVDQLVQLTLREWSV